MKTSKFVTGLAVLTLLSGPSVFWAEASPQSTEYINVANIDLDDEVAAVMYSNAQTIAAIQRSADSKILFLRSEIEELRLQVALDEERGSQNAPDLSNKLTSEIETLIAELSHRDAAYARAISAFRDAVNNITETPEGIRALALYNDGDRIGGHAIMKEIIATEDISRNIEAAQQRRDIAQFEMDMRLRGELTTTDLIKRYEDITTLDPDVHWDWIVLGRLYADGGKLSKAKTAVRKAAETASSAQDKSVALYELGDVLVAEGDLNSALSAYQKSHAIRERFAAADPSIAEHQRSLSLSFDRIGNVLVSKGNLNSALSVYRDSFTIRESLVASDPENSEWQRDLSVSYDKIGDIQLNLGDLSAAFSAYQKCLAIVERLANADPENSEWQRDVSVSYDKIGNVQEARGDLDSALIAYQKSLIIGERLSSSDPSNELRRSDNSVSYNNVGDVRLKQGDLSSALKAYQKSLTIRESLATSDPSNAEWQRDLSVSFNKIGDIHLAQGDLNTALGAYQEGQAIFKRLAASDPSNAEWQRDLIISNVKLGQVSGESRYLMRALKIAKLMKTQGKLAPSDVQMIEIIESLVGERRTEE